MSFLTRYLFLYVLLYILSFTNTSFAQTKEQDSLQKIVDTTTTDTSKFKLLLEISSSSTNSFSLNASRQALKIAEEKLNKYAEASALMSFTPIQINNKEYLQAYDFCKKAHSIFSVYKDSLKMANSLYELARIYYFLEKADSSLEYHHKALNIRNKLHDSTKIATSLNAIGLMNWRIGNFDEAEIYFLKSIKMRDPQKDLSGISITYNNLGSLNWGLSNFNKSLSYFLKALKIAEKNKDYERVVLINNNIGLIYQEWGDFKQALQYHKKAKINSERLNYYFGLAYSYINIGTCNTHFRKYSLAIENFSNALANYKREEKSIGIALSYIHLSEVYLLLKEYPKAIKAAKLSIFNATKVKSKHHISTAYVVLAKIYFKIKKYELAKKTAEKSLKLAQKFNYKEIIKESTFILSEVYYHGKQYKLSLEYYKKSTTVKDSIFNDVKSKQIAEMQAKYETEKQAREIGIQKIEIEKKNIEISKKANMQKALLMGLFASFAIFVLIIYGYTRISKAKNEINLQKEELERANKKLIELSQFKETLTGMIVHDLKNPLNLINNITNIPKIKEPVSKMHTLIMNILDIQKFESSKMNTYIEEVNLLSIIETAIQQVYFIIKRKNINLHNFIPKTLNVLVDTEKLERVLVNLLNNAAKYTPNNGDIILEVSSIKTNLIKLKIIDSGAGVPKERHKDIFAKFGQYNAKGNFGYSSTGLGLTFCKMAMEAIHQEIGIESEIGKGTTFWITLEKPDNTKIQEIRASKIKQKDEFNFSKKEKLMVENYSIELNKFEIFEVTALKRVLLEIQKNEEKEIIKWSKRVEESILNLNDELFEKLRNLEP